MYQRRLNQRNRISFAYQFAGLCLLVLAGCGGRTFTYEPVDSTTLVARAESLSHGPVTVRASVPGETETNAIFGAPLYDNDVQPVWIEVTNNGSVPVRFAPVGTDPYYFSPLEVAWKHRKPYTKESRAAMEQHYDQLTMPRYVQAGKTSSGFVFTNLRPGVKAFNIDLYSSNGPYDFTFLIEVPGFRPDYANVDFENLYAERGFTDVGPEEFRDVVAEFGCCPLDADGEPLNSPVNTVLVGEGIDLLKAMLRGNWRNLSEGEADSSDGAFLFGRQQDATFRYETTINNGYYEIRFWLTPIRIDGQYVWAGETHQVIRNAWSVTRRDPDVDLARAFLLQNLWYSQSLTEFDWAQGQEVVEVESIWSGLVEDSYFTDGSRIIMWISGDPVSLLDTVMSEQDEAATDD